MNHEGAVKMDKFIKKCIHCRKQLISQKRNSFENAEIESLMKEEEEIFKEWKKEWMSSIPSENAAYDDERKLLARFEDGKERNQIFYFIRDSISVFSKKFRFCFINCFLL